MVGITQSFEEKLQDIRALGPEFANHEFEELLKQDFDVVSIDGDGNCFFRAVIRFLFPLLPIPNAWNNQEYDYSLLLRQKLNPVEETTAQTTSTTDQEAQPSTDIPAPSGSCTEAQTGNTNGDGGLINGNDNSGTSGTNTNQNTMDVEAASDHVGSESNGEKPNATNSFENERIGLKSGHSTDGSQDIDGSRNSLTETATESVCGGGTQESEAKRRKLKGSFEAQYHGFIVKDLNDPETMRQPGVWADHVQVVKLVHFLECPLWIFRYDDVNLKRNDHGLKPGDDFIFGSEYEHNSPIMLYYSTCPGHYQPMLKKVPSKSNSELCAAVDEERAHYSVAQAESDQQKPPTSAITATGDPPSSSDAEAVVPRSPLEHIALSTLKGFADALCNLYFSIEADIISLEAFNVDSNIDQWEKDLLEEVHGSQKQTVTDAISRAGKLKTTLESLGPSFMAKLATGRCAMHKVILEPIEADPTVFTQDDDGKSWTAMQNGQGLLSGRIDCLQGHLNATDPSRVFPSSSLEDLSTAASDAGSGYSSGNESSHNKRQKRSHHDSYEDLESLIDPDDGPADDLDSIFETKYKVDSTRPQHVRYIASSETEKSNWTVILRKGEEPYFRKCRVNGTSLMKLGMAIRERLNEHHCPRRYRFEHCYFDKRATTALLSLADEMPELEIFVSASFL